MDLKQKEKKRSSILKKYLKLRSSIYGRVIFIIFISSVFLFAAFGIIFRSVNEEYMKSIISQRGNNAALMVKSALYQSMLENDKDAIQNILDIINKMSGIDDVNLYDKNENLVYSSFKKETTGHSNPNCKECHGGIATMFSDEESAVKIMDIDSECKMNSKDNIYRHLLIRSPILNEPSCYTVDCHAHNQNEKILGSLVIKVPLKDLDKTQKELSEDFYLLATILTILMLVILIIFTRKQIKQPLKNLILASKSVSDGDRSTRLEIKPKLLDDMRMVSQAFNDMLDNLQAATKELENWSQQLEYKVRKKSEELGQAQNELINIEKIASLGKLSLSVAHEINNPLSGILIYTKLVQKQLIDQNIDQSKRESVYKHLKMIENETKRCGDIVKGLLDFSGKDKNLFEIKHLHEILKDTYNLIDHSMKMGKINFYSEFSAKKDLVFCNSNQIKQACIAILVNASEAVTENGEVIIRTENSDNDTVKIEIIDNGSGIDQDVLPHIFEPFFSTKQNVRGTGLGLAIVHGIIKSHNGRMEVKSEPGKGSTFAIILPIKELNEETP